MRITIDTVNAVKLLHKKGLQQRKIATKLGISRSTVQNILANKYKGRRSFISEAVLIKLYSRWLRSDYTKCNLCGRIVRHPCVKCTIQPYLSPSKYAAISDEETARILSLHLHGDNYTRYKEIRAVKEANGVIFNR